MKRKRINNPVFFIVALATCLSYPSCTDFLDAKPDGKLAIPKTLADFEALLDHNTNANQRFPSETEESADNIYLSDDVFNSLGRDHSRNVYVWNDKFLFADGGSVNAWLTTYLGVYTSNTVLEGLETIAQNETNYEQYNQIKGRALFLRALRYYYAAQLWAPVYDESTAQTDMGLPIRTHTDFNEPTVRSSVEDTYKLILDDLKSAAILLPDYQGVSKTIPNKAAAYGLLARTCLAMRQYEEAGKYADTCLSYHPVLMDYNELNPEIQFPIERFNEEVIFDATILLSTPLNPVRAKINPELYDSYEKDDLRKGLFFARNDDGTYRFRGGYVANLHFFAGIAADEMYLIRAESYIRNGEVSRSLEDLNTLLKRCWPTGTYENLVTSDSSVLLNTIIEERRKQLLFRGLRWTDLRRLNKEGADIVLTRIVNGETYTLLPNSLRYTLPIPEDIIRLSGIPQNP